MYCGHQRDWLKCLYYKGVSILEVGMVWNMVSLGQKEVSIHLRLIFTSDGVGVRVRVAVIIRSMELFKWSSENSILILMFGLWSSKNQIVAVGSGSRRSKPITKRGNVHCDWFILPLLLLTLTIWKHPDSSSSSSSTALMTLLMTPTPTLLLVKTSLYRGIQIINREHQYTDLLMVKL